MHDLRDLGSLRRTISDACRSCASDRGSEMAQHARFKVETGVPIYFCDPLSPWQCGSNENTNGLLREHWPKAATFATSPRQSATTSRCG